MKIRSGFVSNSSSSSFLVAWDKPVQSLADVTKYIEDKRFAKRIYQQIKEQKGVALCLPPKDNCDTCERRFTCFTHRGQHRIFYAMMKWHGYEDDEIAEGDCYGDDFSQKILDFTEQNNGRVAYFLRFADFGEGGDKIGTDMRHCDYDILEKLPYEDIT